LLAGASAADSRQDRFRGIQCPALAWVALDTRLPLRQFRRARAKSARCCSADRRFFFKRDAVTIEKPPDRTANPSLSHHRNKLVQRSAWLLGNESKDALGMVLQNRSATPRAASTHTLRDRANIAHIFQCRSWEPVKASPNKVLRNEEGSALRNWSY
jgi:hypothetical protein